MINNMPGGLIQLLTIGLEDAPLILNPEITFFKTIYRKHTNFTIEQILKNVGPKKFDSFHQFQIEKVADLLYGLHFIIDIPFFDVIKSIKTTQDISAIPFEINELSVLYSGTKTYLFYESTSDHYYLIPENYFNLSKNDAYYNIINGDKLEEVLLKDFEIITSENYGLEVAVMGMKNSTLNQLIPVLRLYFNQWNEFWLRLINEKSDFNYFTKLVSQINLAKQLRDKFDKIIFSRYVNYNVYYENKDLFNFDEEIRQYLLSDGNKINNPIYDCEFALNYAINKGLDVETYKYNSLKYNSTLILFILQSLYPLFTKEVKSFTFWKKYELGTNNLVNNDVKIGKYNFFLEWSKRFGIYRSTSYGDNEIIQSQIFEYFQEKYNQCEINIRALYNQIEIIDKEKLWCTLKVFLEKFLNNEVKNICFDDYYDLNSIDTLESKISDLYENNYSSKLTIPNLKDDWSNFDAALYIQPVDLDLLYLYLAYLLTENMINLNIFDNYHFLVLWRNKINVGFFFRTADNLDNYKLDKTNISPLQNVFFELNDYNEVSKKLTFFHNINLQRDIGLDIIRQEFINTVNCESFYGSVDISAEFISDISKNIINCTDYGNLEAKNYQNFIENSNLEITDIIVLTDLTLDKTNKLLTIQTWNKNIYDKIYIELNGNFTEIKKYKFKDNNLYLYFEDSQIDFVNENEITLKLVKEILVPICDIYDLSNTKINSSNISTNKISLYDLSNSIIKTNNLFDNKILIDINLDQSNFYQLCILKTDNTVERINVDISNNYIIQELNINYDNTSKIELIEYDLSLNLDVNGSNVTIQTLDDKYIVNLSGRSASNFYWLISNSYNGKFIGKQKFIPIKSNGTYFIIKEDMSKYQNYTWDLYSCSIVTPNLFNILNHIDNPKNDNKEFQLNQSFYQQPIIFKTTKNYSLPLYIFNNIPSTEYTTSIKINNYKINKILPINPSEFYRNGTTYIPVVYDPLNITPYKSKEDTISLFIKNFDNLYVNSDRYSNLIRLLEDSTNLYKNLIENMFEYIKTIGKTSSEILDNIDLINDIKLLFFSGMDYKNYSVLAPKYYELTNTQLNNGIGLNKFRLDSDYIMIKQIKDIYKPYNKISDSLTNYLKNVSTVLTEHVTYVNNNLQLYDFLNDNQYQEKYDYKYKLENTINANLLTITNYTIETLYPIEDSSNNEIYFNGIQIDISNNNFTSGEGLFEIKDENKIITEYFENINNEFDLEIFNYLGPVKFGNNNFIFTTYLDTSSNYILTDDKLIIDLQTFDSFNEDFKVYKNSHFVNIGTHSDISKNDTKYVYQVDTNSFSNLSFNSLMINYNFYQRKNDILIGTKELEFSNYAIIGDSSGTIETFTPKSSINISDLKIINGFITNIYKSGNKTEQLYLDSSNYKFINGIYDSSNTYYPLVVDTSSVKLYDISNILVLPPCTISNNSIKLFNDNQQFIIDNYNDDYYFKLGKYILKGSDFKSLDISGNLDLSGNFDLWMYPNKYLKLIDMSSNVDISNGKIYFDSTNNLFDNNYYYVNDKVYFISDISNGYTLTDLIITNALDKRLYLVSESNFKQRKSEYVSIIDTTSTETIVPNLDTTNNITFDEQAKLISSFGVDFKNFNKTYVESELDLILELDVSSGINFIKPYVLTSNTNLIYPKFLDSSSNSRGDFITYNSNDLSNGNLYGVISLSGITSNNTDFLLNSTSFTLTPKEGLQKYKLYDGSANYGYLWTLKIDVSNQNYSDLVYINETVFGNNPKIITNTTTLLGDLSGYNCKTVEVLNEILDISNDQLFFTNSFTNIIRQQTYYSSNLLTKNIIKKLDYNHVSSDLLYSDLVNLGYVENKNINGNEITLSVNNMKYLILIGTSNKYYAKVREIFSDKVIINEYIEKDNYNVYGCNRNIVLTENPIYITPTNTYYLIGYEKTLLTSGDIIMVNENIFEIVGLNSKTLLYEASLLKQNNEIFTYNLGYYLLFRNNHLPIIPNYEPIVEFNINDTSDYKFMIDNSDNLVMSKTQTNFSIEERNDVQLYFDNSNNIFYNPFNYILNIGDYLDLSNNLFRVSNINQDKLIIKDSSLNNLDLSSNMFVTFKYPYQPCNMENLVFDQSSNILNFTDDTKIYFEYNGKFIKNINLVNTSLYTRVLKLPKQKNYFENKINTYLDGSFNNPILNISNDITGYDFFYEQPIRLNNIIKFIKQKNGSNLTLSDGFNIYEGLPENYPAQSEVKVYLSKRDEQYLYSNYILDKTNYLKPIVNEDTYHIYNIDSVGGASVITNYDISSQYGTLTNKAVFKGNILSAASSDDFINLYQSNHILLEKTINEQYVSHLCRIDDSNKLYLFTPVESYTSEFYLDKIYPINLNIDNTFSYKDITIYKQRKVNTLPSNELVIWRKFDVEVIGLVETIANGFSVEIEVGDLSNYIDIRDIYIDKNIKCTVYFDVSSYFLITDNYPGEFDALYTKEINYIKTLTRNDYQKIISNNFYERPFNIESIKLPVELTIRSGINNLYDMNVNLNYIDNSYNNIIDMSDNFSIGDLNLNIKTTYINDSDNVRVIQTQNEILDKTVFYVNNHSIELFDELTIQQDIETQLENIISSTNFKHSVLFNPLKTWNTWSLLTNPENEKNEYLINGNIIATYDSSNNIDISSESSAIYFTKSEYKDISSILTSDLFSFQLYNKIKYYQEEIYEHLNIIFKYDKFWEDPITYINSFAIDISSDIIFDGKSLYYNNEVIDKCILNNQFDLSYNSTPFKITITRNIQKARNEITNFINNKINEYVYGVNILDVLKKLVELSDWLISNKNDLKNFTSTTENFADMLINLIKNKLYSNISGLNNQSTLNSQITNLQTSLVLDEFDLQGVDTKNNYVMYDTSYNNIRTLFNYPISTTTNLTYTDIPYDANYKIDTKTGLYPYKISIDDENFIAYTLYKLDFLNGENVLDNTISLDNPIVNNNQIHFHNNKDFDIGHDLNVNAYKTYDCSAEFLGYLYNIDVSSIDLNTFSTIKYKNTELTTYDEYLVSLNYLDSLKSYLQAETNVSVFDYDLSNSKTYITLVKLNVNLDISSTAYTSYFYNDTKYYKIETIDNSANIISIDTSLNSFKNNKVIVTIKATNIEFTNKKIYRLTLNEPLVDYTNFINLQNVLKNFMINDEVQVIDLKFISDYVLDVIVDSKLDDNYIIKNIVHYVKVGEFPPEPINIIQKENLFLYEFNEVVPYNDISSCFIYYDSSYNKDTNKQQFITSFLNDISGYNYIKSTDVIKKDTKIQYIVPLYVSNENIHNNTLGGVINNYNVTNVTVDISQNMSFTTPNNLVFDSNYYYIINNKFVDISNFSLNNKIINVKWIYGDVSGQINFKQVIIEDSIRKPSNNQLCNITLFEDFDLNKSGYLQATDNYGNELGQFVYKFDISINPVINTEVYINNSELLTGEIIYVNPLCVVTNELLTTINSITVRDTGQTYFNVNANMIQKTYIPFDLYKSNSLTSYKLFIREDNIFNDDDFTFQLTSKNHYSLISKYGTFKLEKAYENQTLVANPDLIPVEASTIEITSTVTEKVAFDKDLYKKLFEYIEFMIGDQSIEILNEDIINTQYQFTKDPNKKNMIDKVTKMYLHEGKMRLIVPLEFWFSYESSLSLPLIALPYTDVSMKFKMNNLKYIIGEEYKVINPPEINVQVNIDGILLDTNERDLFAKNQHEYIIERYKQYPNNILDKVSTTNRLIFKNLVKDIYFITQITGSKDNVFYESTIQRDVWQTEFITKKALYLEFIKVGVYTDKIGKENASDFEILRKILLEAKLKTSNRYIQFMNSPILSKQDIELCLYLDSKYQTRFSDLTDNINNLHLYFSKLYKYEITKKPISPIETMNIKAGGGDLFREIESDYFNLVVPYQKYFNSIDPGYYGYTFALYPLENQPSGHLNFSLLDDVVVKSTNNSQVVTKPVILKTIVKEYQIIRIMSGMSSLAWTD